MLEECSNTTADAWEAPAAVMPAKQLARFVVVRASPVDLVSHKNTQMGCGHAVSPTFPTTKHTLPNIYDHSYQN